MPQAPSPRTRSGVHVFCFFLHQTSRTTACMRGIFSSAQSLCEGKTERHGPRIKSGVTFGNDHSLRPKNGPRLRHKNGPRLRPAGHNALPFPLPDTKLYPSQTTRRRIKTHPPHQSASAASKRIRRVKTHPPHAGGCGILLPKQAMPSRKTHHRMPPRGPHGFVLPVETGQL